VQGRKARGREIGGAEKENNVGKTSANQKYLLPYKIVKLF